MIPFFSPPTPQPPQKKKKKKEKISLPSSLFSFHRAWEYCFHKSFSSYTPLLFYSLSQLILKNDSSNPWSDHIFWPSQKRSFFSYIILITDKMSQCSYGELDLQEKKMSTNIWKQSWQLIKLVSLLKTKDKSEVVKETDGAKIEEVKVMGCSYK